jgi:DNA-binding Lrp family transcriptional regulator
MDQVDRELLAILWRGVPLTDRPFLYMAERLGIEEGEVLSRLRGLLTEGAVRRVGAVLDPGQLGMVSAVVMLRVAPEEVEKVGKTLATFDFVTHCYERETAPGWSCNLFCVIHAWNEEACRAMAKQLAQAAGVESFDLAISVKNFKR